MQNAISVRVTYRSMSFSWGKKTFFDQVITVYIENGKNILLAYLKAGSHDVFFPELIEADPESPLGRIHRAMEVVVVTEIRNPYYSLGR